MAAIKDFLKHNFRHFNAAALVDAAEGWVTQLKKGNKMFVAMAGAMSTAELGISLAEMIRRGHVHAISTTGANMEEDIFNLVAHESYKRLPNYRHLTAEDEDKLQQQGLNRVTDTCIPEGEAMRKIEKLFLEEWQAADRKNERLLPYEFFFRLLRTKKLEKEYEIPPENSWMLAACEKNIPVFTPGWEDSTLANFFVADCMKGLFKNLDTMKSGLYQMQALIGWYQENTQKNGVGFFQIGGGISGDFSICVVPLIRQDLEKGDKCPFWSYFCQISDSTTSYGSYSGAVPNEKITWHKLAKDTPKFIIESDASIVAPLIFQYVLESF